MKIGIIHPYFDVIGGAEITSLSLIDVLLENKIRSTLYCVKAPKISETDFFQIFQIKQKKFPLFWKYQRMTEIKKIFNAISNEDFLFIMRGGLFALNPAYEAAVNVVFFFSLRAFASTLTGVISKSISGIEKVDMNERSTFKDYLKSNLFYVPTIKIIKAIIYIISLVSIFLIFKDSSQLQLVEYWSIAALLVEIPFTIYFYIILRKQFVLHLDKIAIGKYFIISIIVFGGIYLLSEQYLEYKIEILEFLPNLLLLVLIGVTGYLILTYLIDSKTRKFFKAIIREITNKS